MKKLLFLIFILLFPNCSFDNKSGIWNNNSKRNNSVNNVLKDFQSFEKSEKKEFTKKIKLDENYKFDTSEIYKNNFWNEKYFSEGNIISNFLYNDTNKPIHKSKKISRYKINETLLFSNNFVITSDTKGNIIVYSLKEKKIISKYNFYKKQFRNIKKKLNIILEKEIVYIADNIGFLYCYDLINNNIVWAKKYNVPFRSNIKIKDNMIFIANQNNNLIIADKKDGNMIKRIPTEEVLVKNDYINSLSLNDKNIFFLNTYGSLYSISKKDMKINWFVNLNQSKTLNPSNLFYGNEVVTKKNKVVVTSNKHTYVLDAQNGSIIFKKDFTSQIKPLIIDDYLFSITKNSLLVAINLVSGKILYSYNINEKISDFLKLNKGSVYFKMLVLSNDKILIFLQNSYILRFNMNGDLEKVIKLPTQIKSNPIFIKNSIAFLDKKNKISLID